MATASPSLPKTFKSYQYTAFGAPSDVLSLNESTPLPAVTGSQILVKVHATSINPIDWKLMKGGVTRFTLPALKTPCVDLTGTVVATGPKTSDKFKIGDDVLALLELSDLGGLSEYTLVEESLLAKKPAQWTFEQAAALPLVACTVWEGLVDLGKIKEGSKVLINGASGGTGTVGVQVAKALGAYVVGVCSTPNVQLVKDLGADEVVDYKTTDITEKYTNQDFDIIFDTVGLADEIWAKRKTILKPTGNLVCITADENAFDTIFSLLGIGAKIGSKKLIGFLQRGPRYNFFLTRRDGERLEKVIRVLDQVNSRPTIDSVYDFSKPSVLEAFTKSKSSRAKGKLIVKID